MRRAISQCLLWRRRLFWVRGSWGLTSGICISPGWSCPDHRPSELHAHSVVAGVYPELSRHTWVSSAEQEDETLTTLSLFKCFVSGSTVSPSVFASIAESGIWSRNQSGRWSWQRRGGWSCCHVRTVLQVQWQKLSQQRGQTFAWSCMNLLPCVCCNGTRPPGKHYLCRQTRFSELPQETPHHYARLPPQEMPQRAPFCHPCRPGGPGWRGMWELWPGGQGPSSATCTLGGLAAGSSSVKQRLWSLSLPFSVILCLR